jgi:phage-related tail protein
MAVNWGSIASAGMQLASQYAAQRQQAAQQAQQSQQVQNQQGIAQNQGQNNVLLQMAQIELLRKQMQEQNRSGRAAQTAMGDVMANVQDAHVSAPSHIPRFEVSGGLRPSALGPNARAAGGALSNQALAALLEGDSFMPITPAGPINLDATMPEESTFDKWMGGIGAAGNVFQAMQQRQQLQQAQAPRSFQDALQAYMQAGQNSLG